MSDTNDSVPAPETAAAAPPPYSAPQGEMAPTYAAPAPAYGGPMGAPDSSARSAAPAPASADDRHARLYTWYWYYKTSDEMKQHSGRHRRRSR